MVGIRIHLKVAVAKPEKLVHLKPLDPSILHTTQLTNLRQIFENTLDNFLVKSMYIFGFWIVNVTVYWSLTGGTPDTAVGNIA